jgi:AraC family transcriptional regulator, regulatory protein of adaptative response / methylated-DNA-[protein]-cysteine methyltransferase
MTPGTYRRGGQGTAIGFRTAETPVGVLLLAATGKGVCFVTLGDSGDEVENLLRAEYPRATIHRDDGRLSRWTEAIVCELGGGPPQTDVPFELVGTDFQKRVWRAIRSIPRGETRSYGEVAESMGRPAAARAVAAACAANRIALIVPCHRVVRANGDAGGYRWGRDRKDRILQLESSPDNGEANSSRPGD